MFWLLGGWLIVSSASLFRLSQFIALPLDRQISFIPDDTFYYLVLAKNFSLHGVWTFDGHSTATGFHLLFAYLLAGLYYVAPNITDPTLFALLATAGTLLLLGSFHHLGRAVSRDFGPVGALGVVLLFTADRTLQQPTFMVESSLVIFLSCALLNLVSKARASTSAPASNRYLVHAFLLGLAASLSRSDFGLLPATCAVVFLLYRRTSSDNQLKASLCLAATIGAILGVAAALCHTLYWSGHLVQNSARIKAYWSTVAGYNLIPFIRLIVHVFASNGTRLYWAISGPVLIFATALISGLLRTRGHEVRIHKHPLATGAGLAIVAYVLFYGCDSQGIQPWYLANVLAPLAYLVGAVGTFLTGRVLIASAIACCVLAALSTRASLAPLNPHQLAMKRAGTYLRDHPRIENVGAWNAGIISHFSHRPIVNLDGLVNDDVYRFITERRLLDYVRETPIDFIVDFDSMLDDRQLAARGGYQDGRLRALLSEELNFSRGEPDLRWRGTDLKLYRVDRPPRAEASMASIDGSGAHRGGWEAGGGARIGAVGRGSLVAGQQ